MSSHLAKTLAKKSYKRNVHKILVEVEVPATVSSTEAVHCLQTVIDHVIQHGVGVPLNLNSTNIGTGAWLALSGVTLHDWTKVVTSVAGSDLAQAGSKGHTQPRVATEASTILRK